MDALIRSGLELLEADLHKQLDNTSGAFGVNTGMRREVLAKLAAVRETLNGTDEDTTVTSAPLFLEEPFGQAEETLPSR